MKSKKLDQLIETLTGIRAGKPWQFKRSANLEWEDPQPGASPNLIMSWGNDIRLKHWTLSPPPEGKQWHRCAAFAEADLPEGYRPLLLDETVRPGDEVRGGTQWKIVVAMVGYKVQANFAPYRTKRPLPVEDPYAALKAAHAAGKVIEVLIKDDEYGPDRWSKKASAAIWPLPPERYRIKPDPVSLGPEDVPPMSLIRKKGETQQWHWRLLNYVDGTGMTCADRFYPWKEVMHTHEILRPDQAWQPCHKPAP